MPGTGEDQTWTVSGLGLRDHSWGPRTWQAPWYYRWLTMNFADGTGLMLSRVARPDGPGTRGGFVWDGHELHVVRDVQLRTDWTGTGSYHSKVHATFSTGRDGDEGITRTVTGEVLNLIPLRNRREGRVTRISEGLTRWHLDRALGDDESATLGPKDPDGAARRLAAAIDHPVAMIDANDAGCNVLGASPGVDRQLVRRLFADNPLGQAREQTPIAVVRRVEWPVGTPLPPEPKRRLTPP